MDKTRHHVIFWVGYFFYNLTANYIVTHHFRKTPYIIYTTIVTILLIILTFYLLANRIYPQLIPEKKYIQLIIYIFLLGLLLMLCYYYIMLYTSYYFSVLVPYPTQPRYKQLCMYFIVRYLSVLYISPIYWYMKQYLRNEQQRVILEIHRKALQKSANQAQLLGLKNQINPHFLYNILNFFYAQFLPTSRQLSDMILSLSKIMRYSIVGHQSDGKISISQEIDYITSYLNLELGKKSNIEFDLKGNVNYVRLKPLTLWSFIEITYVFGAKHTHKVILVEIFEENLIVSCEYDSHNSIDEENLRNYIDQYRMHLTKLYDKRFDIFFNVTPDIFKMVLTVAI